MANPAATVSNPSAADAAAKANGAQWYAFQGIGRAYLIKPGTSASSDATAAQVHGYPTIEQAIANPNGVNALSQLTISQWNEYASLPVGGGSLGVVETVDVTWNGSSADVSTPQNPTTAASDQIPGLQQIGDFFTSLDSKNTWVRVVKVVIGGALLIAGIVRMSGAGAAVGKAAKLGVW